MRSVGNAAAALALNRTIVGWKHELYSLLCEVVSGCFKSHHSGMETTLNQPRCQGRAALNRTIVGWKLSWMEYVGVPFDDFKSHHSGMETCETRTGYAYLSKL